jgi:hypothetical protein
LDVETVFVYTVYTNRSEAQMSDKNGALSEGDAPRKPGWPEGFWEELERMPFPADFDVGEDDRPMDP